MPDRLKQAIRDVPDFPKPGIIFKDITPILSEPALLQHSIDLLIETTKGLKIDKVVGLDARGFIFAPPVAMAIGAGFIPIRKAGKLPWQTLLENYSLEYGENSIEIHQDAIEKGENIFLIDDLLATGGTANAAAKLVERLGANLVGASFLIELSSLNGRKNIDAPVHSILTY